MTDPTNAAPAPVGAYRDKTETFIAGLRAAAEAGESVGFH